MKKSAHTETTAMTDLEFWHHYKAANESAKHLGEMRELIAEMATRFKKLVCNEPK